MDNWLYLIRVTERRKRRERARKRKKKVRLLRVLSNSFFIISFIIISIYCILFISVYPYLFIDDISILFGITAITFFVLSLVMRYLLRKVFGEVVELRATDDLDDDI